MLLLRLLFVMLRIPDKVIVALTSAEGFSGHLKQNPFNVQHMNVRQTEEQSGEGFHSPKRSHF